MTSWSTTTAVSSSPLVGSAIYRLIDVCIEIRTQPPGIDAGRTFRRLGNHRSRYEPPRRHRPQRGGRHAVARDDDRLSCLHFPEHGPGMVAKLTLKSGSAHARQRSGCITR